MEKGNLVCCFCQHETPITVDRWENDDENHGRINGRISCSNSQCEINTQYPRKFFQLRVPIMRESANSTKWILVDGKDVELGEEGMPNQAED